MSNPYEPHITPPTPTSGVSSPLREAVVQTINADGTVSLKAVDSRAGWVAVPPPPGYSPTVGDVVVVGLLQGDSQKPVILRTPAAAGGASSRFAMVGPSHASTDKLVQDPGDPYGWYLALDGSGLADTFIDSADFSLVDHLGAGRVTMLVPKVAGAYSFGGRVSHKFAVSSGGPGTFVDIGYQAGPMLVGKSGASYYDELHFGVTNNITGYSVSAQKAVDHAVAGFAPSFAGEGTDGDEYGVAWKVDSISFSTFDPPANRDVRDLGWAARLWMKS